MTVRVSYVVLARNSQRYVGPCVRSLLDQDDAGADEVIVVDNGSTDNTRQVLADLAPRFGSRLRIIELPVNGGTTAPRNLALRATRGEFVSIVDSDVVAGPGVVKALIDYLAADSRTGLVAPALTYPSGELQLSCDAFPTITRKVHRYLRLRKIERAWRARAGERQRPMPVDYAISAFWMLPRRVVDQVGELDEAIFYAPEDVDYCIRVWAAGWKVMYVPSVSAIHHAQEISRGMPFKGIALSHAAGLIHLYRKHGFLTSRRRLLRRLGPAAAPLAGGR